MYHGYNSLLKLITSIEKLVKICSAFCFYVHYDLEFFLSKFQKENFHIKLERTAHAQIATTRYYEQFTNFQTRYEVESYIGNNFD